MRDELDDFALEPGKWRWDGTAWVAYAPPLPPDLRGFEGALKVIFANDLPTLNRLLAKHPLFLWSLRDKNWPYVEQMIVAAKTAADITSGSPTSQYERIKAEAAAKRIPVTLP